MKANRRKKAAKVLTFFRYHFGYLPPYSLLMDGTFCQAAIQHKLNLREQLPKYLSAIVEIFTTKCVLHELETLGAEVYGALAVAKSYGLAKCPHTPMRNAAECIKHMARRSRLAGHTKYLIGTQDNGILENLREFGGVPLLSIRFNTILIEKPSETSFAESSKESAELKQVRQLKAEILGETKKHRRKVAKGPNPLSCKSKKKRVTKKPVQAHPAAGATDEKIAAANGLSILQGEQGQKGKRKRRRKSKSKLGLEPAGEETASKRVKLAEKSKRDE